MTCELSKADMRRLDAVPEMLKVLNDCLLLFAKDHALDHFDWGKSFLRAQDIQELNDLPFKIRKAIDKAEGRS